MERISGGEAIVRSLIDRGVDTVFGLPGVQTYAVFDALRRHGGKIASVFSRHEQGAGYMAFGYARVHGQARRVLRRARSRRAQFRGRLYARPGAATSPFCALPARFRRRLSASGAATFTNCPINSKPCARWSSGAARIDSARAGAGDRGRGFSTNDDRPARPRSNRDGLGCHGPPRAGGVSRRSAPSR